MVSGMETLRRLLAAGLFLMAGSAVAADPPVLAGPRPAGGWLAEARLGVAAHDPWSPEAGSATLTGLLLFRRPFLPASAPAALVPLPHLGFSANPVGKTSHAHAGLTWQVELTARLFVEGSLGAAFHDGRTGRAVPAGRNALGCRALFREAAAIGYRLEGGWTVTAGLEHLSNAGRCNANRGLTNVGVMLGYRF
jgi:hypothetical protein